MEVTERNKALCIAVDWGSSNLRAFLIDQAGTVLDQKSSDRGMLSLNKDEFEPTLAHLIASWPSHIPVFMAGMVGSRGGWHEVLYQICPISLMNLADHVYWLPTTIENPVAIVPGLRGVGVSGHTDVMRGEETQLLGVCDWLDEQNRSSDGILCCMPGTHCKWVPLSHGRVSQFSTTFSGELFARLNDGSSLVKGLPQADGFHKAAFSQGLVASQQAGGLLHHLFSARSEFVCGDLPAGNVRDYLSGIIIGHDVNQMLASLTALSTSVLIVGGTDLTERYSMALDFHSIRVESLPASEASIRGLKRLALNHLASKHSSTEASFQ